MIQIQDHIQNTNKKAQNEYTGICPKCNKVDSFTISLGKNRYFCRQCKAEGDLIQYLQDFQGISSHEAGKKDDEQKASTKSIFPTNENNISLKNKSKINRDVWAVMAENFLKECSKNTKDQSFLADCFITRSTALNNGCVWNNSDKFLQSKNWGIDDGKKLFIPKGLVISSRENDQICNLMVQNSKQDRNKYRYVKGSIQRPFIAGKSKNIVFIMESVLDALLLYQESFRVGVEIACVALNSFIKKIDDKIYRQIINCKKIVLVPDNDEANIDAARNQSKFFPSAQIVKAGQEKNLGELASKYGGSYVLADWLCKVLKIENKNNRCALCLQWRENEKAVLHCNIGQNTLHNMICPRFIHVLTKDWQERYAPATILRTPR